jgi:hypothetical protein
MVTGQVFIIFLYFHVKCLFVMRTDGMHMACAMRKMYVVHVAWVQYACGVYPAAFIGTEKIHRLCRYFLFDEFLWCLLDGSTAVCFYKGSRMSLSRSLLIVEMTDFR